MTACARAMLVGLVMASACKRPTPPAASADRPSETVVSADETAPVTDLAPYAGSWKGMVLPGLPLVLNLAVEDGVPTATLDSPNQQAFGIQTTSTLSDGALTIAVERIQLTLVIDRFSEDALEGTFSQATLVDHPMRLEPTEESGPPARPQDPVPPLPYAVRDVAFESVDGVTLAGTLTHPEDVSDVRIGVVLLTGSGPQDRDEALMGHRPFLVLADHLSRNGIAVLRYDDRGFGESTGSFAGATTDDFAVDAAAAMAFLRETLALEHAGYVGHSEGALVAPLAHADEPAEFLVLLAGPTVPGDDLLQAQKRALGEASGMTAAQLEMALRMDRKLFDIVEAQDDPAQIEPALRAFVEEQGWAVMLGQETLNATIRQLADPWMVRFMALDPAPGLDALDIPALALFGEKDLQVPPDSNAPLARDLLGADAVVVLPGLNHLFQPAETGLPGEYGAIDTTVDPSALDAILAFVQGR
jgi:pimeloyl-ACP methyl ester carboxylesterase